MVLMKKEKQINCFQRDLATSISVMRNEDFLIGGLKDADQHRGLPEFHTPTNEFLFVGNHKYLTYAEKIRNLLHQREGTNMAKNPEPSRYLLGYKYCAY